MEQHQLQDVTARVYRKPHTCGRSEQLHTSHPHSGTPSKPPKPHGNQHTHPPVRPPTCLAHCPRGGRVTPLSKTKVFKVGPSGRRRGAKRRSARFHKARQCALSRNLHVRQHNLKLLLLTQNKLNRGVWNETKKKSVS